MTEFLRMSGVYWGVTALDIMGQVDRIDRTTIIEFIKRCQNPITGGVSPCEGHDPHILYTLSAVQVSILAHFTSRASGLDAIIIYNTIAFPSHFVYCFLFIDSMHLRCTA